MTPLIFSPPPPAVPPTRAVPQFVITESEQKTDQVTEAATTSTGRHWPEGIDYSSVSVPAAAPRDEFLDPLDVVDLLED